jgi:hypothetical protein
MPVIAPGPVPGSTALPAGEIAEEEMIVRVPVGSGLHGT